MAAKRETARKFLEDTEVEFADLGKKMEDLTHEEEDLDDGKKKASVELDKGETKKKKLETELAGINEAFRKKTAKAKLDKAVAKTEAERGWSMEAMVKDNPECFAQWYRDHDYSVEWKVDRVGPSFPDDGILKIINHVLDHIIAEAWKTDFGTVR